jgi:hypothetical protein
MPDITNLEVYVWHSCSIPLHFTVSKSIAMEVILIIIQSILYCNEKNLNWGLNGLFSCKPHQFVLKAIGAFKIGKLTTGLLNHYKFVNEVVTTV